MGRTRYLNSLTSIRDIQHKYTLELSYPEKVAPACTTGKTVQGTDISMGTMEQGFMDNRNR